MEDYLHRVVGLYPTGAQADSAVAKLLQGGLAIENLTVLEPRRDGTQPQIAADDEDILKEVLREGAIGTAIGTFAGAAGSVALAAVNISLFIASPVLAPLVMLGWGASLGGLVGAVAGAQSSKGGVSDLIRDALASGHFARWSNPARRRRPRSISRLRPVSEWPGGLWAIATCARGDGQPA